MVYYTLRYMARAYRPCSAANGQRCREQRCRELGLAMGILTEVKGMNTVCEEKADRRIDGRRDDQIRPVRMTDHYLMSPQGSVLIEMGNTKVICTASVEESTARHLTGTGQGWVTAEYGMLPGSTGTRKKRDKGGKQDGRSVEIQRLIGRALRSVVDMKKLGERTIWIDCDVIQADGGTRTASITGAFVAMVEAMAWMMKQGMIDEIPVTGFVSAISVGMIEGAAMLDGADTDGMERRDGAAGDGARRQRPILDLCYQEDSRAAVDMNVVMTDRGEFIEIQGTGEQNPFSRAELSRLLELAEQGCRALHEEQKKVLGAIIEIM